MQNVLLPEFQPYTDQFGLISDVSTGESSGNGLLYTAHYAIGLVEKKLMTKEEQDRILQVISNCQRQPGLFMRSPVGQTNYQAHDDLLGIMGAESKMFPAKRDRQMSQAIFNYGSKVECSPIDPTDSTSLTKKVFDAMNVLNIRKIWCFNTKSPGTFSTSAWLGLRREVIATMAMSSGNQVGLFDWLYWAGSMLILNKNSSNNSYILACHSCWAVEGYGPLTDWIVKRVQQGMKDKYGDFGKMLGTYFQDQKHPLIKLLDGIVE